jgi:hypothetical protein
MTDKKDAFIIARVPKDLRSKFLKAVAKQKQNVSEAIRGMVENFVKYNG